MIKREYFLCAIYQWPDRSKGIYVRTRTFAIKSLFPSPVAGLNEARRDIADELGCEENEVQVIAFNRI